MGSADDVTYSWDFNDEILDDGAWSYTNPDQLSEERGDFVISQDRTYDDIVAMPDLPAIANPTHNGVVAEL